MSFSLCVFIKLSHHFVVVSQLAFLQSLLNEMFIDDCHELVVPLIKHLRCYLCHIGLIQEQPVRVLALKYGEVAVEKGTVGLKGLLARHLLLYVVRSVHQMV